MGNNLSQSGITRDLEAMKEAGIGGATIFSLADTTTPWASTILKSPTPEIVSFTEPWWRLLRHATSECRRLELELTLHNCAGYESSGGPWITPELSMQEVIFSEQAVSGGTKFVGKLAQPVVDLHPHALYPDVYIPSLGRVEKPIVEARKTYYRDIAVLALPADGPVALDQIVDLTSTMAPDGDLHWDVPAGNWKIYRLGHTTTGAMIQPAQWDAMGLECDKMNADAVAFHVQHVLTQMKEHLGDLAGSALKVFYFDSYEAGEPTWTPKMAEEFRARRGYEITSWLPVLIGRTVENDKETARFKNDFKRTVFDLYRDCYWATAARLTREAGLEFGAEPYEGPWEIPEVVKFLDRPTVEFWTNKNRYSPVDVDAVVAAARVVNSKIIGAESFTSQPEVSRWTEHPAWLKPIGDAAFCAGVNSMAIHHCVQQPWDDRYKPGNVMGQWGIHLGRNQTWWKPGRAWFAYLGRCQALLQRGNFVAPSAATSAAYQPISGDAELKTIHRRDAESGTEIYFLANTTSGEGTLLCSFPLEGKHPELWDPVIGASWDVTDFGQKDGRTTLPLQFAPAQSFFVIFRKPTVASTKRAPNFPTLATLAEMSGPWDVSFDPKWGGPASERFDKLDDWITRPEPGIKYYSGTAIYKKTIKSPRISSGKRVYLDLGTVKYIAEVTVNGKNLGVVWTAPWHIDITDALKHGDNKMEIAVSNVWANRLIGDEHEPPDCVFIPGDVKFKSGDYLKEFPDWFLKGEKRPSQGRFAFVTWNYFTKDSPLVSSGLIGPVRLAIES
ncbi:MAG: hypothetical protein NVS9B4_25900 [Candidatus Acidiferrum sp.]